MVLLALDPCIMASSIVPIKDEEAREKLAADETRTGAHDLLNKLVKLFPSKDGLFSEQLFRLVRGEDLPSPFDEILNHEDHLTATMESRHGGASVKVLDSRCLSDSLYCRRILLLAPCGKIVTFAILLADLDNLPEAVRVGVREERIPFGRLCQQIKQCHLAVNSHSSHF